MHEPGMDTLTSIKAFRRVIESGSFVAAADRLADMLALDFRLVRLPRQ